MEKSELLWKMLEVLGFLIPVGGLIWKAAKQAGRIDELERKISSLTVVVANQDTQNKATIEQINKVLNALNVSMARIETSISFIEKSVNAQGGKLEASTN